MAHSSPLTPIIIIYWLLSFSLSLLSASNCHPLLSPSSPLHSFLFPSSSATIVLLLSSLPWLSLLTCHGSFDEPTKWEEPGTTACKDGLIHTTHGKEQWEAIPATLQLAPGTRPHSAIVGDFIPLVLLNVVAAGVPTVHRADSGSILSCSPPVCTAHSTASYTLLND